MGVSLTSSNQKVPLISGLPGTRITLIAITEAVRTRWVEPRRQDARQIVCRGVQSGELRAGLDPDVVLDALYGPFYHRLLVPYKNGVISDAFINALVDTIFGGLERDGARAPVQSGNRSAGRPDDTPE
jgi:hypothetical protein